MLIPPNGQKLPRLRPLSVRKTSSSTLGVAEPIRSNYRTTTLKPILTNEWSKTESFSELPPPPAAKSKFRFESADPITSGAELFFP